MRIGIMGGTFDPIHIGHLIVAQEAAWKLEMDQVFFMPSARPPHKQNRRVTPDHCRLEMVRRATTGNPLFGVEPIELEREELSYTAVTLELLRERLGPEPQTEIFFIIGTDAAADLLSWQRPDRVLELAHFAVVGRPGYAFPIEKLQAGLPSINVKERVTLVDVPLLEIAAQEIRERVQLGAPIHYLVPASVEEYIFNEGLYRDD